MDSIIISYKQCWVFKRDPVCLYIATSLICAICLIHFPYRTVWNKILFCSYFSTLLWIRS